MMTGAVGADPLTVGANGAAYGLRKLRTAKQPDQWLAGSRVGLGPPAAPQGRDSVRAGVGSSFYKHLPMGLSSQDVRLATDKAKTLACFVQYM
jgi:hypothetical protein